MFFTYKAVNDSVMFNADAWTGFFKRLIGKREVRNYQRKEVIMTPPDYEKDMQMILNLTERCSRYLDAHKKMFNYVSFWKNAGNNAYIESLGEEIEQIIEDLRNSDENFIIGKLMDYPVFNSKQPVFMKNPKIRLFCAWFLPVGIILYLWELYKERELKRDLDIIRKVNDELLVEIKKLYASRSDYGADNKVWRTDEQTIKKDNPEQERIVGLVIRQLKDIQSQADKILSSNDKSNATIESFAQYSISLKEYINKNLDNERINLFLTEIPNVNYSRTKVKLWSYLISSWYNFYMDYIARNKTLDEINIVREKYALLELMIRQIF